MLAMLTAVSDITSTTVHCAETASRILQIFCYNYCENVLALFEKNFGFLAGVVSKMLALEMHLQQTATLINIIVTQ